MELLLVILVVVAFVFYLVAKLFTDEGEEPPPPYDADEYYDEYEDERLNSCTFDENIHWLRERWRRAEQVEKSEDGSDHEFRPWYFDAATESQLRRLRRMGITLEGKLTKGQASDLIGLGEEPDEHDRAVLKFFKVPLRGMNQTQARAKLVELFADPENREKWENRLATPEQRECIRFYGEKVPKGLKHSEAAELINELAEKHPEKEDQWDDFQSIIEEFNDKDSRELLEIKKPSAKLLRECIEALQGEGYTLNQLASDTDLVAQRLIEMEPDLERPLDD